MWKRTSNSYNISSLWICSIKADIILRMYYNLSWKYVNTVEIISKVTITLSLINSNKVLDFVFWVIKTPCLYYFRSVKFHYVKETHNINSPLTLVKIVLASQQKDHQTNLCQDLLTILQTPTQTWKCTRCTIQMSYWYASHLPFKNFCKLAKQAEIISNSQQRALVMIKHCLGHPETNSISEWRVFLLKVPITPKSFFFFRLNKSLHLFETHCAILPPF